MGSENKNLDRKLRHEALESRRMLATVVNTNDSGSGSLREAITLANSTQGFEVITFSSSLFASGTPTITLRDTIIITEPLRIEGPSGMDFRLLRHGTLFNPDAKEAIELRPQATNGLSQDFEIRDLILQDFEYGIRVSSSGGSNEGVVIKDNTFDFNRRGIFFERAGTDFEISNNTLMGAGLGEPVGSASSIEAGIYITHAIAQVNNFTQLISNNRIGGYEEYGIRVYDAQVPQLVISDNTIGADDTGSSRPNNIGIEIHGSAYVTSIGSISENEILYNNFGIQMEASDGAIIVGNTIRQNVRTGLLVEFDSDNNQILGNDFIQNGLGNAVHAAGAAAIEIGSSLTDVSTGNRVSGNYFRQNGGLPIDLVRNGTVEPNDYDVDPSNGVNGDDLDEGPNRRLNYPEVDSLGIVEKTDRWIVPVRYDTHVETPHKFEFYRYTPATKEYTFIRAETPTLVNGDGAAFFEFLKGTQLNAGDRLAILAITESAGASTGNTSELVASPSLVHTPPPRVSNVKIKGSTWTDATKEYSFTTLVLNARQPL
jgi:parallel beta-helix repeat protein